MRISDALNRGGLHNFWRVLTSALDKVCKSGFLPVAAGLALLLSGCSTPERLPPPPMQADRPEDYRLSVNDLLDFRIYQEPDFDAVIRVAGDGTAIFPMIGRVQIAGKTIGEATELLALTLHGGLPDQSPGESHGANLRPQVIHHFGASSKAGNIPDRGWRVGQPSSGYWHGGRLYPNCESEQSGPQAKRRWHGKCVRV